MAAEAPTSLVDAPEVAKYLDDTVRVWLGVERARGAPQLPPRLARRLLRLEEYETARRDRWGCWDHEYSESFRVAEIDRWVAEHRSEPLWPNGAPFAVCLTHDVDLVSESSTPRQVARYARAGFAHAGTTAREHALRLARPAVRVARSLRAISRAPSMRETLERSVELEIERGVVASYLFTVPPVVGRSRYDCVYAPDDPCRFRGRRQRIADVMRELADEGFDVGLHGSYEGAFRPGGLAAERGTLERATGLDITTTRQHVLHWDVRWTPRLQADAGLRVDSSLGFNRTVGFRAGTSLPFRWFDVRARRSVDLLEVPLVVHDAALLGPIAVRADPSDAVKSVRAALDGAHDTGTAVTLVFHPDKLIRSEWLVLYERSLDYARERGAWITSLRGLEHWWREREARVLG